RGPRPRPPGRAGRARLGSRARAGSARSSSPGERGATSSQHLRELGGKTVDVAFRVHFRDAVERALPEPRVLGREVEAAEDPALAKASVDLGHRAPALAEVDDELLEERPAERRRAHAPELPEAPGRVLRP